MTRTHIPTRRGMTMIELLIALAITAMVAVAIAAMLSAVTEGERSRRDNRGYIIRTHAARARLGAYIARSLRVLEVNGSDTVVWLNDWRQGGTVHATELRWLIFDGPNDAIDVYYVDLPDAWTEIQRDIEDVEYSFGQDWSAVLSSYMTKGYVSKMTLVDGVGQVTVTTDQPAAVDSTEISFELRFPTARGADVIETVVIKILKHQPPAV